MTIHTFVDASKGAPGVVCLARSGCEDGTVETQLIASRTKVTPLAAMCTPRLQLSAAVLYRVPLIHPASKTKRNQHCNSLDEKKLGLCF